MLISKFICTAKLNIFCKMRRKMFFKWILILHWLMFVNTIVGSLLKKMLVSLEKSTGLSEKDLTDVITISFECVKEKCSKCWFFTLYWIHVFHSRLSAFLPMFLHCLIMEHHLSYININFNHLLFYYKHVKHVISNVCTLRFLSTVMRILTQALK